MDNYKIEFIFHLRPIKWFLRKDWYSLYRWKHPFDYGLSHNATGRVIDIGAITIGYRRVSNG